MHNTRYHRALPRATTLRQASSCLKHALESRPSTQCPGKQRVAYARWQRCTLPAFTCCRRPLGKPFLALIWPILASFVDGFMGAKRPENCRGHPPNPDKDASKSHKNGVWGHFGPFGGHFYPFYIYFQGNTKKKSTDVRSQGAPFGAL